MRSKLITSIFCCLIFIQVSGQDLTTFFEKADDFFSTYIQDGRVKYAKLKENPKPLNDLVAMAENISVSQTNPQEYQAFWVNTYNIITINGIVENYPVASPLDIPGFFDSKKHQVGGASFTLNEIENDLLRGNFPNEPRFHFVLVCAGLGCPPIISEAYTPSRLESQLLTQTQKSLNNPNFIKVSEDKVEVSQIFEWYREDFTHNGNSTINFINNYREKKLPKDSTVDFYPYNWKLNDFK